MSLNFPCPLVLTPTLWAHMLPEAIIVQNICNIFTINTKLFCNVEWVSASGPQKDVYVK